MLFPEAKAFILTRNHSDHYLIRFSSNEGGIPQSEARPFRFEGVWLTRDDYYRLWKAAWTKHVSNLIGAIEDTKDNKIWNREVFGHITAKKKKIRSADSGDPKCAKLWVVKGPSKIGAETFRGAQ